MLDMFNRPQSNLWHRINWRERSSRFSPDYCIVARLKIVDRDFWIEGAVLHLTTRGALFREASSYMLHRSNEETILEMENSEFPTRLVMTEAGGYRLEFFDPLPDATVTDLCDRWGIDD